MTHKKMYFGLAGVLVFVTSIAAAVPDTLWTKTYGGTGQDGASSVCQTSDGGYIFTGWTNSSGTGIWLVKTDTLGNKTWDKVFAGSDHDWGTSVIQAPDGGCVLTGETGISTYNTNLALIKTDADGNVLWNKNFGGDSYDIGYSLLATSDTGYVIAGYTDSYGAGYHDVWLVKTDASGDTQWTKTYGGTGSDEAYAIAKTSDAEYIITGWSEVSSTKPAVLLLKTDTSGNELWSKTFGGDPNDDRGEAVLETQDKGFIIAGISYTTTGSSALLIKTDSLGNKLWDKTFGATGHNTFKSMQTTADGGFIMAGGTSSEGAGGYDVWLVKTDASGNEQWSKTFGAADTEIAYSIAKTSDGGYIVSGFTNSFGAGSYDAWLLRLTSEGAIQEQPVTPQVGLTIETNPLTNSARISFTLNETAEVAIKAYDVSGKLIEVILQKAMTAGVHVLDWNTKGLGRGVYFVRLETATRVASTKIMKF